MARTPGRDNVSQIIAAQGVTSSVGITGSTDIRGLTFYANQGGTKSVKIGYFGGEDAEISASGPLNIVGAATLESTLNVTGGIFVAKTAHTHNLEDSASDTQNSRSGRVSLTIDGALSNGSAVTVGISNSEITANDVVVAAASTSGLQCFGHAIANGSFNLTAINRSGGTIADDTTIVINYTAL